MDPISSKLSTLVEFAYASSHNADDLNAIDDIVSDSNTSENEKEENLSKFISRKTKENIESLANFVAISGSCEMY